MGAELPPAGPALRSDHVRPRGGNPRLRPPGAIGAATAFPDRRVVALVGDGGLGFGWGELETLARERLRVVRVVLNNDRYAYQKLWHDLHDGTSRRLDFADVRHDRLVQAVGITGLRVEKAGELELTGAARGVRAWRAVCRERAHPARRIVALQLRSPPQEVMNRVTPQRH
ncbi:thiamine pyrophosphate-dependent enzyme [Streptosporangium subroseum]|uniref:thiamine pyrophosphate-dependent enzyme n=1 Tax=Streptosporangium subroseum TaxID=106412 RepID=UPI003443D7E8